MGIDRIGAAAPEYVQPGKGSNGFQPSPTAADFAAMIRKLAGPEMVWEAQTPEELAQTAERDTTEAQGVLASGKRLRW